MWDQMGPKVSTDSRTDSAWTSVSSSVTDAISFSTLHISVESLPQQWMTSGPWHHKLIIQLDAVCGQLGPLCLLHQATSHNKTCDVLQPRREFLQSWGSLLKLPKEIWREGFQKKWSEKRGGFSSGWSVTSGSTLAVALHARLVLTKKPGLVCSLA